MPSISNQVLGLLALAVVDSDAATPVYRNQRGMASTAITRTGAGDYTLTTSDAYDSTRIVMSLVVNGGALHGGSVEYASTTTLRVRTYTVTATPTVAAADLDYSLSMQEISPN